MAGEIHVLEDMLTPEQCVALCAMYHRYAERSDRYDYNRTPVVHYDQVAGSLSDRALMQLVVGIGTSTVRRLFGRPNEHTEAAFLARIGRGHVHIPHIDNAKLDGTPNHTPQRTYSSLFYLNSDFDGGEIRFPNHFVSVKPKAGIFVAFPSSPPYLHYVSPVESGYRYSLPIWFTDQPARMLVL